MFYIRREEFSRHGQDHPVRWMGMGLFLVRGGSCFWYFYESPEGDGSFSLYPNPLQVSSYTSACLFAMLTK